MYIYAIKSIKYNYIYVGITKDFDKRINRHNLGREKTTKFYSPFKPTFLTTLDTRIDARSLEKYLKSGIGKEFLRALTDCRDGGIGRHAGLKNL